MKNGLIISLFLMFVISSGCSTVLYQIEQDRSVIFSDYYTFNFCKEMDSIPLSLIDQERLKRAITAQLQSKKYLLSRDASFLVNVYLKTSDATPLARATFQGQTFDYTAFGIPNTLNDTYKFPIGTLFIFLIDVQNEKLIWEGIAEGFINKRTSNPVKSINRVITRMFNNFPKQLPSFRAP